MRLRLLGDIGAVDTSESAEHEWLPVVGRRHRLILAMLGARRGRSVTDDSLIEAIWGDESPRSARTAVQTYVSELRDALEPGRQRRSPGSYLATGPLGYRLTGAVESIDHEVLEATLRDDSASVAQIDAALAAWGEPFAEFGDHPAFVGAATRLREAHARLLERRFELGIAGGHGAALTDRIAEAAASYPYREVLACQLMTARYQAGDQRDALAAGRSFATLLREDLGLDPGERHRTTLDAILHHRPTVEPSSDAEAIRATEASVGQPARRMLRPLVGRQRDLVALGDAVERWPIVTVLGVGGVGKTSLVAAWLDAQEADPGSTLADAAIVDVDMDLCHPGGTIGLWRAIAAGLAVSEQLDAELEQNVTDAIGGRSTVVVIDTAEVATDVVASVARGLARQSATSVIITSQVPLPLADAAVVRVKPLTDADAVEVIRSLAVGADLSDDVALDRLVGRLDRIPLGLEIAARRVADLGLAQTARDLDAAGSLDGAASDRPERHRSTIAAVEWSVAQLDPRTSTLLDRLAVHRAPFDLNLARHLWATDPLSPEDVDAGVRELVARSLLFVLDGSSTRFRLLDTIRAVVDQRRDAGNADEVRLAEVVLEAAQASMFRTDSAVAMGQVGGELARAHDIFHDLSDSRELVLAGSAALWWPTQGRCVEGLALIERALRANKSTAPDLLYRLVVGVGAFVSYATGDLGRTATMLAEMGEGGTADLVPDVRLHIEGSGAFNSGRYADAVAAYGELVDRHPEPTGPKLLVMWVYGNSLWYAGRPDDAIEAYQALRDAADSIGDSYNRALSLRFEAMVEATSGRLDRAWRLGERALAMAREIGDPGSVCQAEVAMAVVAFHSDAPDLAEQYALDSIRTTLRPFDLFTQRAATSIVAAVSLQRDDPKRAAMVLGWYLDYLDRTGQLPVVATARAAADAEAGARESLGSIEFSRLAARGAAMRLAELYDELVG